MLDTQRIYRPFPVYWNWQANSMLSSVCFGSTDDARNLSTFRKYKSQEISSQAFEPDNDVITRICKSSAELIDNNQGMTGFKWSSSEIWYSRRSPHRTSASSLLSSQKALLQFTVIYSSFHLVRPPSRFFMICFDFKIFIIAFLKLAKISFRNRCPNINECSRCILDNGWIFSSSLKGSSWIHVFTRHSSSVMIV